MPAASSFSMVLSSSLSESFVLARYLAISLSVCFISIAELRNFIN
jgi:hypothetical protein